MPRRPATEATKVSVARPGQKTKRELGTLDPGFPLAPNEKVRVITGNPKSSRITDPQKILGCGVACGGGLSQEIDGQRRIRGRAPPLQVALGKRHGGGSVTGAHRPVEPGEGRALVHRSRLAVQMHPP